MSGKIVTITLLCFLFVSIPGFSQTSTNAQLTGIVTDQSGALIPGVTITATKADTGVVTTTLTNEAGVYTFQSLQPGRGYSVSAALPGFQTINYTDLELSAATVFRRNFQLQVAAATTTLEVSVSLEGVLLESSPSVGDVLTETRVRNLPIVGNNVLDLLDILPGVRFNGTGAWMGDYANTVGGQSLDSLNVTLDGLPMRDERFSASSGTFQSQNLSGGTGGGQSTAFIAQGGYTGGNSLLSTTTINPDLVGEVRLVLAPVDAEFGRGNSQIQITTRSGTNQFAGAAVWNVQNTSLNPNTWNRNNDRGNAFTGCKIKGETPPCWQPTQPDWRNTHQTSLSFGGPIVKNKTFFFVLYDQQISKFRALQTNTVLTDTARKGIFRFWEGWVPGDADIGTTAITTSNANPTRPAVDFEGRPLAPAAWPNGVPYTGRLACFSVFGTVKADGSPFSAADCAPAGLTDVSGRPYSVVAYMPPGGALLWDPKRPAASAAALGYFNKLLKEMPTANNFEAGQTDGLNTAAFRWLLNRTGGNEIAGGLGGGNAGQNALVGSAAYQNRKQINIKIDHNFALHRIAGSWTHQVDESEVPFAGWPNGLSGLTSRGPHTLSVNVTSTLRPNLINESRFGLNLNTASTTNPWNLSDSSIRDRTRSFFLQGGTSLSGNGSYPILVSPSSGGLNFAGGLMPTGADAFFRN
ncbi:MAG: carboxypeptidase regulatory-like domain-containing protein, partial [Acidobacteria bacterium]|nr:carboxypeptidase regulatory-like domain-containing protein [Acidobacteriota bacterium]